MPTVLVKGDIFDDEGVPAPRAYAFGAETSGAMDRGVAIAFGKRWPALAAAFAARCAGGKMQLGDVFAWRGEDDKGAVVVYALGIQRAGAKPKVSTLERALRAMLARAPEDGVSRIALPRVGAGKGGLDWSRVKRVLAELGESSAVSLVVFEQFVRGAPAPEGALATAGGPESETE
jgi:O-acetyl-ADP-ribose deacetylase (regulator of RNase III)